MNNKIVMLSGLLFLSPGINLAAVLGGPSGIRDEIKAPEVTEAQSVESQLNYDKWVAEHPGFLGEKMTYIKNRQQQATTELALYDTASSSFKLAGPTGPSEKPTGSAVPSERERKIQYLKMVVDRPGFLGENMTYTRVRKAEAEEELRKLGQ